jgi:trimeric autotransporter adhesin
MKKSLFFYLICFVINGLEVAAQSSVLIEPNATNGILSKNSLGLTTSSSNATSPAVAPVSGQGTRLMWIPSRSAFRVGTAESTEWNVSEIGLFSMGLLAKGKYSIALGAYAGADKDYSVAIGNNAYVNGFNSLAFGNSTHATGHYTTVMGVSSSASGNTATAMGRFTQAQGWAATALGDSNVATGHSSTAMGYGTTASGDRSTAMGGFSVASGFRSVAAGTHSTASGENSLAFGYIASASGYNAISLGQSTNQGRVRRIQIDTQEVNDIHVLDSGQKYQTKDTKQKIVAFVYDC